MKSCRVITAVAVLLFLPAAFGTAQESFPRVAVIPFSPLQVSKADAEIITGLFETALVKTGLFNIIEQNRISEILEAQEYSISECTDEICAVRLGRLLSAEQIILGTCSSLGGRYVLNAKIIDVATGKNIRADKVGADTLAALADGAEELANKLCPQAGGGQTAPAPLVAAKPAAAEPRYVEFFVETDPQGAEIYVDGVKRGTSPELMSKIPEGRSRVEARKGGLYAVQDVDMTPPVTRIRLVLKELRGNLFIKASEPEVRVLLDGKDIGRLGAGFFEKQPAGPHSLELRGKGLYWKGDVEIRVDESTRVDAVLKEFGDLRYRLPEGVTASVTGVNFSQTVSGSGSIPYLDIGFYSVTFTGDGYVPTSDSFEVKRGTRVDVTPNLARTREYEENRFIASIGDVENLLSNAETLDKVPSLIEKLRKDISGSRYSFDNLLSRIDTLQASLREQVAGQNAKRFSDDMEKYRMLLAGKHVADRDVKAFEKRLAEAEKSISGSPELIARARALLGDMRLQVLELSRDGLIARQERAVKSRKGMIKTGWATLGVSALVGGAGGLLWYLADMAYDDYKAADTSDEAMKYHDLANGLDVASWSVLGTAGGLAGVSLLLWGVAPKPAKYDARIEDINRRIEDMRK